ncbi:hypothetical protein [Acinetobacter sp. ANC 4648]|uniref:hypothetical protein n=1 Tax=Acinetobacter sp. ANC 4648 TaxID=1977875 RepID=UPI000A33D847|nr:hypothetical protein [Acinetobacter sp. ANC 4648]OTG83032.1 hypothetical protein B9T27_07105 [Acinetobacter sp. ANC 4648]
MKIGIFWHFQNQIIGIAHDFDLSDQDSLGLIDSAYIHVKYWEEFRNQIAELRHIEYEEIPRGRVIYNSLSNKTIVYMDAKLFKKRIAKQIAVFFELNFDDVIWQKDPHYKT